MKQKAAPNILIGAVLLLLLCIVSGRPQIFSDTKSYYALGQEAALALHRPDHQPETSEALRGRQLDPGEAASATRLAYTVSASRSPYWSVLFYLAVQLGSAWLVVVLQSLVAAGVLWIAARALGVRQAYLPIVAALAFLSSLPVQVMFLMPDLFAGLTILAALVLAVARQGMSRRDTAALWLVMAAGALFHTSHLLTLAGLGAGTMLAAAAWRDRTLLRPGGAMLAAAAVGAVGAVAFPLGVQAVRHEPIYAPPFLSARLIADGPGRSVLRADCVTGREWGWCPYLDRPLVDVNTILWNTEPPTASFQAADYDRRVRMIGEQPAFVLAVVRRYPGAVASTIAGNVGRLFFQYRSTEALGDPTLRYRDPHFAVLSRIVPGTRPCATGQISCAPRLDLAVLDAAIGLALLVSCGVIAGVLGTAPGRRGWGRATLFLFAGLCLNAVVCGGISGNAQRYQSRVTWLVPLLALAMAAEHLARRAGTRPTTVPARRGARP